MDAEASGELLATAGSGKFAVRLLSCQSNPCGTLSLRREAAPSASGISCVYSCTPAPTEHTPASFQTPQSSPKMVALAEYTTSSVGRGAGECQRTPVLQRGR